ncbi:MAG: glycosyltransferase [Bacteroidota bacterium]
METVLILKWLICFFSFTYLFLIIAYWLSWNNLPVFSNESNIDNITKISIIIPTRNEHENIANCLQDINNQSYPKHLFEILIVNDDSTDDTVSIINEFKASHPSLSLKVLNLYVQNHSMAYKKNAISLGISQADGELIITTDADCRFGKDWIKTIATYNEKFHPKFISSPVCFINEKNLFERMQTLEFLSLIGIGAAAINMNKPNMCNGANIAFERKAYLDVNGYDNTNEPASGDDMFLLLKMAKKYPHDIAFLKSKDVIVYTYPKKNISEFYQQRKRWASKGTKYNDSSITLVAAIVYFANAVWLLNFILLFLNSDFMYLFFIQTSIRAFIEVCFLFAVTSFFGRRKLLLLFPLTFIFNIFYVIIIGMLGSIGSYEWKGRTVK